MQLLDHDDNGKVSESELRQLLLTVGDCLSHQEVCPFFSKLKHSVNNPFEPISLYSSLSTIIIIMHSTLTHTFHLVLCL